MMLGALTRTCLVCGRVHTHGNFFDSLQKKEMDADIMYIKMKESVKEEWRVSG